MMGILKKRIAGTGLLLAAVCLMVLLVENTTGQPINPQVYKKQFEKAKADADVVAKVRVLAAVCTGTKGDKVRTVTLQVSLQVLDVEKGPVKKNDVLVVSHDVGLPTGPGPRSYGYMGALRRFPFTPGVKGDVALRWDKERKGYVNMAGWVEMPNNASIPTEVGKAFVAGDPASAKK
jgi:hypothetical protein